MAGPVKKSVGRRRLAYWLFAIPTRTFCEGLPGLNPKFPRDHRVLRTII